MQVESSSKELLLCKSWMKTSTEIKTIRPTSEDQIAQEANAEELGTLKEISNKIHEIRVLRRRGLVLLLRLEPCMTIELDRLSIAAPLAASCLLFLHSIQTSSAFPLFVLAHASSL